MNNVTVYLTESDAKKFLQFQKNYDSFNLMINSGVFEIKNGSAVINFDAFGTISTIQRADMLYNVRIHDK